MGVNEAHIDCVHCPNEWQNPLLHMTSVKYISFPVVMNTISAPLM